MAVRGAGRDGRRSGLSRLRSLLPRLRCDPRPVGTPRDALDPRRVRDRPCRARVPRRLVHRWRSAPASDACRAELLHAAEALGARHIKVGGDLTGEVPPAELLVQEFASLCRDAAGVGTRISIELMPFSNLATLEDGLEIADQADEPNGGLCLDIWHLLRAGVDLGRVGDLPSNRIVSVELNDGPAAPSGSLWDDAVENRTFCGEGEFPIRGLPRRARSCGFRRALRGRDHGHRLPTRFASGHRETQAFESDHLEEALRLLDANREQVGDIEPDRRVRALVLAHRPEHRKQSLITLACAAP